MANETERYMQLISQSKLFLLDKESEPSTYQCEQLRMIENLYCYLMSFGRKKYEKYGLEITETAKRCIRNYDDSKGTFLAYFLSAWKQEFSHIVGDKQIDDKLRGIKISEDDRRCVIRCIRFLHTSGAHLTLQEVYRRISISTGMSIEDVERIVSIEKTTVLSDVVMDSDGNEFCIWDQFYGHCVVFNEIDEKDAVFYWLNKIETVFSQIPEKQKAIVSDLLTVKLCGQFSCDVLRACQCRFLNNDILDTWQTGGELPSQREIAEKYGKKESSISRTLREFRKKIAYIPMEGI